MPEFTLVYVPAASFTVTVTAETLDQAEKLAYESPQWPGSLCHQCSHDLTVDTSDAELTFAEVDSVVVYERDAPAPVLPGVPETLTAGHPPLNRFQAGTCTACNRYIEIELAGDAVWRDAGGADRCHPRSGVHVVPVLPEGSQG